MTDLERKLLEKNGELNNAYADRVVELVREQYSLNDELAIQRQRDTKVTEFETYNTFVEECKAQAHQEIFG